MSRVNGEQVHIKRKEPWETGVLDQGQSCPQDYRQQSTQTNNPNITQTSLAQEQQYRQSLNKFHYY